MTIPRRLTMPAVAALSLLALVGCSSGQTLAEACEIAETELVAIQTEISAAGSELSGDPEAGVAFLRDTASSLEELAGSLSNGDVSAPVQDSAEALDRYVDEIEIALPQLEEREQPDNLDAISGAEDDLLAAFESIDEVCSA